MDVAFSSDSTDASPTTIVSLAGGLGTIRFHPSDRVRLDDDRALSAWPPVLPEMPEQDGFRKAHLRSP